MPRREKPAFGAILIADDHEVFRFGLAEVLRCKLGASHVFSVGRFEEAMALISEPALRLAIFDLRIPGLTTPKDLYLVRQQRPGLKVVVLSGSDARQDILAALEAGVHGYLVKNECTELLVQRIQHILSGEIYVPPALAEISAVQHGKTLPGPKAPRLTARQIQVLDLITEGHSNKAIANLLHISHATVKMHIAAAFRAIGARNRTQAAAIWKKMSR